MARRNLARRSGAGCQKPAADHQFARCDVEIEQTGIALVARARQHRPGMGFVQALVGRKAHVAIDAEDAASGIADQRQPGLMQRLPDGDDQLAEWGQHFSLVDRFARLEPGRVVVIAQLVEKRECCRPKPGKSAGRGHRSLPSSSFHYRADLRQPKISGMASAPDIRGRRAAAGSRCRRSDRAQDHHRHRSRHRRRRGDPAGAGGARGVGGAGDRRGRRQPAAGADRAQRAADLRTGRSARPRRICRLRAATAAAAGDRGGTFTATLLARD